VRGVLFSQERAILHLQGSTRLRTHQHPPPDFALSTCSPEADVDAAKGEHHPRCIMTKPQTEEKLATCHCGAVTVALAAYPIEVTDCNCSLCRRYGVLWAYYSASDIVSLPEPSLTDRYAWNGRHVDFHRCRNCGCVTHWLPRDAGRD
jgi:hypothetical protein